jgi:hypothetical protein
MINFLVIHAYTYAAKRRGSFEEADSPNIIILHFISIFTGLAGCKQFIDLKGGYQAIN